MSEFQVEPGYMGQILAFDRVLRLLEANPHMQPRMLAAIVQGYKDEIIKTWDAMAKLTITVKEPPPC